jgi:uncharacterized surface protein with fasciclin (FAS1) repeats
MSSLYDRVRHDPALSRLAAVIEASAAAGLLTGRDPVTLFAPDDRAFDRLSLEYRDRVVRDHAFVRLLVGNHVVSGLHTAEELHRHASLDTAAGERIAVRDIGGLRVGGARILRTEECDDGVVHVIESVLVPLNGGRPPGG